MGHEANGEQVLDVVMETTPCSNYESIVKPLDHNSYLSLSIW